MLCSRVTNSQDMLSEFWKVGWSHPTRVTDVSEVLHRLHDGFSFHEVALCG